MKILTLNLHCFAENNIPQNQEEITNFIIDRDIDVCFFQEVAQHYQNKVVFDNVKEGNYVLELLTLLKQQGYTYYMHYDYSKRGFNIYDEGLAIISKTPLIKQKSYYVSRLRDYYNWKTRKNVSCETFHNNKQIQLTSVHFGWSDELEKFEDQFDLTYEQITPKYISLIAGDYNISEGSTEYNHIIDKGLHDLYYNGDINFYHDVTHLDYIDVKKEATRIDYVFSNKPVKTIKREIVFTENRVSDHFGVYLEIEV